jgi:PEP-CTERM motif
MIMSTKYFASQRLNLFLAAATGVVAFLNPSLAKASIITETITFHLSGFQDATGNANTAPFSSVDGSFTLTYDPSLSYDNDTADIMMDSLTGVGNDVPVGFSYEDGVLGIGGTLNQVDEVAVGTDDFAFYLDTSSPTAPAFITCGMAGVSCGIFTSDAQVLAAGYATSGTTGFYLAGPTSSSVSASVVPEPSTLASLSTGLLAIAGAMRRRARKAGAPPAS